MSVLRLVRLIHRLSRREGSASEFRVRELYGGGYYGAVSEAEENGFVEIRETSRTVALRSTGRHLAMTG